MRTDWRIPTDDELFLLEKMLQGDFPGSQELRNQLRFLKVRESCDEKCCPSIEFSINDKFPNASGSFLIEAAYFDNNDFSEEESSVSSQVQILLHAPHGRLTSLEFLRSDTMPIQHRPCVEKLMPSVRLNDTWIIYAHLEA